MCLKISIINPPQGEKYVVRDLDCTAYAKANLIVPQIGLAYVAAMLEDEHDVKIIDCAAERFSHTELRNQLEKGKPDICTIKIEAYNGTPPIPDCLHVRGVKK